MDKETLLTEYFNADESGEIRVQYTGHLGTGSKVQILDRYTGEVVAEYTVVIFGDADGDGIITQQDVGAIKGHVSGAAPIEGDSAFAMAADMDGDGAITMQDAILMKSVISGAQNYDQSERKLT